MAVQDKTTGGPRGLGVAERRARARRDRNGARRSIAPMYDHNQTLVPDSFLALYARHGRPTIERAEAERRYELAEDLALHIARTPWVAAADGPREQAQVLARCRAGLSSEPAQVTGPEAGWIIRRVAELQDWNWSELGFE